MNRPDFGNCPRTTDKLSIGFIFSPMRSALKYCRFFFSQCLLLFALSAVAYGSSALDSHKPDVEFIPDSLISLPSDDGPAYAIVVEKDTQTLRVYEYQDGFSLKHTFFCSTGEVPGSKQTSGDRKTPEGIYFITKAFTKRDLSATYGSRAFVMDYPNFLDRKLNRDGNSIWLHGTNKPLKPRDSNGCVALQNEHIDILARYIQLNRTAVVVRKKLHLVSPESLATEQKGLTKFLDDWKKAFVAGDKARYIACYEEPPSGLHGSWETWDPIRTAWENARVPFGMSLENITLARGNPCVVALFDHFIHLDSHVAKVGTKKLFLEPTGNKWKIVGEVYQPEASHPDSIKPLGTLLARLDQRHRDDNDIAALIAEWADAWSSRDTQRYGACYAENFHSKGMDLSAWIRYKEKLNKQYKSIEVSIEDVKIRKHSDRSTATFVQRYRSSGHQSAGRKTLRLKRTGGGWKIYREIWHGRLN
jgi:murein L,D-transpeptidase YafK